MSFSSIMEVAIVDINLDTGVILGYRDRKGALL